MFRELKTNFRITRGQSPLSLRSYSMEGHLPVNQSMLQRIADEIVLGFFSVLFSAAVLVLRLRRRS
jgi:hypothetical protein